MAFRAAQILRTVPATVPRVITALLLAMAVLSVTATADANGPEYTDAIATLHDAAGGKTIATIMPATPVDVIIKKGSDIRVEIIGWSPAGGEKYLFKGVGLRINLARLTADGVSKRVVVGTKDDAWGSTWQQVKISGWLKQDHVVAKLDAVWKEAAQLYYSRCSRCHSLRKPAEFTANQWPHVLKVMAKRAGFSAEQAALVTALLQYHGKGQQVSDAFTRTAAPPTAAPPAPLPKIAGTPELAAKGAQLFRTSNCNACHGDDAKTPIMPAYPKLAGQNAEYLLKQILDFKTGARANDANSVMKNAVQPLSQDDAKAIAYWLSTR